MEQDIVNNLKSRVQKLEEELLRVVGIKLSQTIVLVAGILLLCCFSLQCIDWECTGSQVVYVYALYTEKRNNPLYPLDFIVTN